MGHARQAAAHKAAANAILDFDAVVIGAAVSISSISRASSVSRCGCSRPAAGAGGTW